MAFVKPKVGLVLMANEWFWKYKMFGQDFLELIESDCKFIYEKIKEFADVVYSGLVLNTEQAKNSIREIKGKDVDLLIICPVIWTSDIPFIEMLQEIPKSVPIILWFYMPSIKYPEKLTVSEFIRATGPVGAAQFASVLKRDGRKFKVIVGSREDEEIFSEMNQYAKTAKLSNDLRRIRIGLLPSGYPDIANTWCDEFKITSRLGPRLIRISVYEYYKTAQELSEEDVKAFVKQLEENYKVEVSRRSLSTVARASLALAKLFDKYQLDAIAIQDLDDEMHQLLKTRPSLYVPSIFEKGRVVGMEGDVHTTIAMIILSRLTGQPVLFAEVYSFDTIENTMLMGHTTMLDIRMSRDVKEIRIIPDCEYQGFDEVEGAYMYFVGKEGVVTMLSLVDEIENYRLVAAKGVSLHLKEPKTDGYSHILVRPTINIKEFFKRAGEAGVSQHWAVTYGDHISSLKKFAELTGLNITVIE